MSATSAEMQGLDAGSFGRATVLDAFVQNPRVTWTPIGLSSWFGIRIDLVRAILAELAEEGIVSRRPGRGDRYVLAPARRQPRSRGPRH